MNTPIDVYFNEHNEIIKYLNSQKEFSYALALEDNFRRTLLISSASYIETKVQKIIVNFFETHSSNTAIVSFLKNKALKRQYHTLFQWDGNNINSFFGLFGSDFKSSLLTSVEQENMSENIKSFLELGKLRNELVHQNYLNYTIQKSYEEIYKLYKEATNFIEFLDNKMSEGTNNESH